MTSRFKGLGSLIAFPFALAASVAVAVLGVAAQPNSKPATPAPTPTPTGSPAGYWQQQLADAQVSLESNSTALHAAWLDGQDTGRLTQQWCAAAKAHNTAARHLTGIDQISTKDCP